MGVLHKRNLACGTPIFYFAFHSKFFVGQSWIGVFRNVDGSAVSESFFAQEILHNMIVVVGIHTQMAALTVSPFDAGTSDSFCHIASRQTMEDTIGAVVQPSSVFDYPVVWFYVLSKIIEKSTA